MLWTMLECTCLFGAVASGLLAAKHAHAHVLAYVFSMSVGLGIGILFTAVSHVLGGRLGDRVAQKKHAELYLSALYLAMTLWAFCSIGAADMAGAAIAGHTR